MGSHLTVGALARRVGLRPSAVRYYEARGVLPPADRGANGYRFYPPDMVGWLGFVRRAQAFGMTLDEIKQLLHLAGHPQQPCRHVREIARDRLRDVEARIRELTQLRAQLRSLLRRRPRVATGKFCPLIEDAPES
jgi:DNA-binding transcriptional MerR regulator